MKWQPVLNLFVCWNVFCLLVWTFLPDSSIRSALLPVVTPYMFNAGLLQDFWVFSPDINTTSAEVFAVVTLDNGKKVTRDLPRIPDLSTRDKMIYERYRVFSTSILRPQNRYLLPDVAAYIAEQVADSQASAAPVEVALFVRWQEVPPPGSTQPGKGGVNEFFRCKVGAAVK